MTGYKSKKAAAQDKLAQPEQEKEPETFENSVTTPSDIEAEIARIEKQRQELEAWANFV
jgi:hypothetical protein